MNQLTQAVYQLLETSLDRKQLAASIAAYFVAERRTKDVNALLRNLESWRLSKDGVLEVTVTTARPLSPSTKQHIAALFDAKKILIHEERDPSLIGGVKVRAHDKWLDYSVRTRLQHLKQGQET